MILFSFSTIRIEDAGELPALRETDSQGLEVQ
jgi:hypothetical protein